MAKVEIEVLKTVLQHNKLDTRTIARILEDIAVQKAEEGEDEKETPCKKQSVVLLSDPDNIIVNAQFKDSDLSAWIVQVPEDQSAFAALRNLTAAAKAFNLTKKGRRMPIQSVGDACEYLRPTIAKEHNIWIRTKLPVTLFPTNGDLDV